MNKQYIFIILAAIIGFVIGGQWQDRKTPMMHHDMSGMMMDMNAALTGKTGDNFDKAFIDEMIVHHEGAVDMAELALTNAKHQEIKDLATAIIKAQTTEIEQMKNWKASWYK